MTTQVPTGAQNRASGVELIHLGASKPALEVGDKQVGTLSADLVERATIHGIFLPVRDFATACSRDIAGSLAATALATR